MGGNAFKQVDVRRIQRNDIKLSLQYVGQFLASTGMTYDYMASNLMGSADKQNDSGDLDVAVDEAHFSLDTLRQIVTVIEANPGQMFGSSKTLKGGQIQTAWPIAGNPQNGYVQVDFILGKLEWLKFSHWSPGKDASPYKGVYISTLLGVLAKIAKDYELYRNPETGEIEERPADYVFDPKNDERTARVGLNYDLEKGLKRSWMYQKRRGQGPSKSTPEEWETNVKLPKGELLPPRFARIGFVTNPDDVVRMLLGPGVKADDIQTFETLWAVVKEKSKNGNFPHVDAIADRFAEALTRSSSGKDFKDKAQILSDPIFN